MIDMHVHCFPDFLANRALGRELERNKNRHYDCLGTIEEQLAFAEEKGLRAFAVLNVANRPDSADHVNEYARRVRSLSPKIVSFCSVHPKAENAVEQLDALYEEGFRCVKFQSYNMRTNIDEPCFKPLLREVGRLKMLCVIHGGYSGGKYDFSVLPENIARAVEWLDGADVIASHLGGMFMKEEERAEVAKLPVYTDTAFSQLHFDQDSFNRTAEMFGPERILFGTDLPWAHFRKESAFVENSSFTEAEKQLIFEGNAVRLLSRVGITV